MVQLPVEISLVLGQVCNPWHVNGNNPHRAGALTGAKETAGLLAQFPQVQTEAAAHASHIAWLHVAVDVVGKVRRTVFGGHLEEKPVVLRVRPVKIIGNGIGRNGILEPASVGIALDHGLDECLVDHIHFLPAVLVLKIRLPAAHNGIHLSHVIRDRPVQGDIGKRSLGSPAAGGVHAVDKGLDALLYLGVA